MSGSRNAVVQLVDYRAGNLFSIRRALEYVGAEVILVRSSDDWDSRATHVVLPGVGAYAAGMDTLRERELDTEMRARAAAGMPLLGICLGAQRLFESSEEFGRHSGLGLLAGQVRRLPAGSSRIPHIGWAICETVDERPHPVFEGHGRSWMYFVHSYVFEPRDATRRLLNAVAGGAPFAAAAGAGNVLGVQFHPERSGEGGLQLLRQFCTWGGDDA